MRATVINCYLKKWRRGLAIGLFSLLPWGHLYAETVSISLVELQRALDEANQSSDPVARDVLDKISQAINDSDLGLIDGDLLYNSRESNITVEGGCNRTVILEIDTNVTLESDTSLSLSLESLYDPIVISLNVSAQISSIGEARQILGIRIGRCRDIARDTFEFDAQGPASFTLDATLLLNPAWTDESTLSLFPEVTLNGELTQFSVNVDVDDTILSGVLESFIEDRLTDIFSSERLAEELSQLEAETNESVLNSLDNGRFDIELPEADDAQILALYQYLQPEARFPITLDVIRNNRQQILSALLFGEPSSVQNILSDAVLCESSSSFVNPISPAPLYDQIGGQCSVVESRTAIEGDYFSDDNCTVPIAYKPTSLSEHCAVALDQNRLGNAELLDSGASPWTHSPGSQFDVGALSLDNQTQPFMRQFNYKTVETLRGVCELEMRVYTGSPGSQVQKPLLALHGGSWQNRASSFLGLEATATHFTNNGFIVFAPFYRLIGESDGNIACNDAELSDILSDTNDALDWINNYSSELGLQDKPTIFGQSAGGHLALSLAVNRREDIRRAILFYAPTDFEDFAGQINRGTYTNPSGFRILEAVTGSTVEDLDIASELVVENSFPARVSTDPDSYPPMFIMHGEMDTLLPFRQSVRLCNALSGSDDPNTGPASNLPNLTELSSTTVCNSNGSVLQLIAEGEHALDLCIAPQLCLSGSAESADRVASSIQAMLLWASADNIALDSAATTEAVVGKVHWLLLWLLFLTYVSRVYRKPDK